MEMTKGIVGDNKFDLEGRTLIFAKNCIDLCKMLMCDTINRELISQLVRASGSVGANYREANEALTKKDFFHRIGICRKEAKESKYWLELLSHTNPKLSNKIEVLADEALQLARIFSAIVKKRV
ncbi:MAG: four helix bundle protein [Candidatus Omnitrophota bacterium]